MNNTTLTKYEKETPVLIDYAQSIAIRSSEDLIKATDALSRLNKYNDMVISEEEKVTIPLKEALKAEQARFKPLKTLYKEAIDSLRSKMGSYQTLLVSDRLEAESRISERIKEGKGNLTIESAVKQIEALPEIIGKTETGEGSVSFRTVQELEIYAVEEIPRLYLIPDEQKIKLALKSGEVVKGARMVTRQTVFNKR